MKSYIYPSVLQNQAIPAIKKAETKNVVICYQELTGIKLTVFLPLLNSQIRQAVQNSVADSPQSLYSVVLCHSFVRCQEVSDTIKEITAFCSEMVEVVDLDTSDLTEVNLKLKKSLANSTPLKSRLLIMTPSLAVKMQEKNSFASLGSCHSLVIDKFDLLQALDFGSDLLKLTVFKPTYRCIFTTTDTRVETEKPATEVAEYKEIKKVFMG
jgi:hypothetical protein